MQITNKLIPSAHVIAIAAAMLGACASETGAGDKLESSGKAIAASGSTQSPCLAAADVSSAIGLPVRDLPQGTRTYGNTVVCAYQGTNDQLGVFVTTIAGPAGQSDEIFRKMRESARLFLGANAEPEAIQVGERGYAYGSNSKSEAAAVLGGRGYHAEVVSSASANIGDKKVGMIEMVKKLMDR